MLGIQAVASQTVLFEFVHLKFGDDTAPSHREKEKVASLRRKKFQAVASQTVFSN